MEVTIRTDLVEMKERINTRIRKKQPLEQNIEFIQILENVIMYK